MIKLFDNGAYLLHGTELVEDNAEAGAVLASKIGSVPSRKRHPRTHLPMEYWRSTTHQTTWTISR